MKKECVSCDDYTKYMLDYFKIAQDSKKKKRVYWHQLIASGYGLVDNRDGKILKYPQFYVFKELLQKSKNNFIFINSLRLHDCPNFVYKIWKESFVYINKIAYKIDFKERKMKIFIEILSWLGDAIMATPAIQNIIKHIQKQKLHF